MCGPVRRRHDSAEGISTSNSLLLHEYSRCPEPSRYPTPVRQVARPLHPQTYPVTINAQTVPVITGRQVCVRALPPGICHTGRDDKLFLDCFSRRYDYSRFGTNSITVTWSGSGPRRKCKLHKCFGLHSLNPGVFNVTVNPTLYLQAWSSKSLYQPDVHITILNLG